MPKLGRLDYFLTGPVTCRQQRSYKGTDVGTNDSPFCE